MGVVLKQSINNTLITYLGFGIGAINILFLYTKILPDAYFGLVTFILATSAIFMPLMTFGVHNTLVKFYSAQKMAEKNGFLTLMLLCPLITIVPLAILTFIFYDSLGSFISKQNAIVKDYVWYIFIIGMAMAYFEVFYAWSKVQLKSVFGNFMKEVFVRLGVTVLLILVFFELISLEVFLKALVGLHLLRTLLMKLSAFKLYFPKLDFNFPEKTKSILVYSLLIILGGSAALILLEIDKVMINQFEQIENVAYYGVAVYIATVIIVPSRAMHQITYPLTAELLNTNNYFELESLYKKTSLTLLIGSGLIFILIILNLNDLYLLLPEAYRGGYLIVMLIGMAKVFDSALGNINAILFNSKYYRTVLVFGVCLALATILLNLWLIPLMGIEGAALASFIAIVLFNCIKLVFVKFKFGFLPFGKATVKIIGVLFFLYLLFLYLQFPFNPVLNIMIKSAIIVVMYLGILHRFNISEDISGILAKFIKRRTP
ncbi:MAG: oligosaccharide flippase family protein [Croceitalea sp.]|nr:oligosaccharide flippase family protein [Croceitalea sp.]